MSLWLRGDRASISPNLLMARGSVGEEIDAHELQKSPRPWERILGAQEPKGRFQKSRLQDNIQPT